MEIKIDEKLDESIYQGMRSTGKTLYEDLLEAIDNGIRGAVPETWKNTRVESTRRQPV